MSSQAASFSQEPSALVRQFVERAGEGSSDSPEAVIVRCVEKLRAEVGRSGPVADLMPYRQRRNVHAQEFIVNEGCDGWLRPKGATYESGFVMGVRGDVAAVRQRFTVAHELCHSFFYEYVPELKFQPHATDLQEETLCDRGAACLLLPEDSLRQDAQGRAVSVACLDDLARLYAVSRKAMFLRLRDLGLWKCELSVWQPTVNGKFMLEDVLGGRRGREWSWAIDDIPQNVWQGRREKGQTWIHFKDESGSWTARRVYFDAQRLENRIFTLWSNWRLPLAGSGPLLSGVGGIRTKKPKRRSHGQNYDFGREHKRNNRDNRNIQYAASPFMSSDTSPRVNLANRVPGHDPLNAQRVDRVTR